MKLARRIGRHLFIFGLAFVTVGLAGFAYLMWELNAPSPTHALSIEQLKSDPSVDAVSSLFPGSTAESIGEVCTDGYRNPPYLELTIPNEDQASAAKKIEPVLKNLGWADDTRFGTPSGYARQYDGYQESANLATDVTGKNVFDLSTDVDSYGNCSG